MAQRGVTADIDLVELEKLCALQCTDQELAGWFNVTTRTIERKRKVRAFREVMERGKAKGQISVRRMQMKLLEEGNATMGVWLGKQMLGQRDVSETQLSGRDGWNISLNVFDAINSNPLRPHRLQGRFPTK
jgi:hypothetical protein